MLVLGNVIITSSIIKATVNKCLTDSDIIHVLKRHIDCDWGDICVEDKEVNNYAMRKNGRLISSYFIKGMRIWVVTDNCRTETTVFLLDDI